MALNGSTIVNYPTGYTVLRTDYVGLTANDIYNRFQIQQSVVPCIFTGLQVTPNTGLIVSVSAGSAQGQNLEFTQSVNSPFLPTNVGLAISTNVTCTDNTTGWIVLNVNVLPGGPTTNHDTYSIITDDGTGLSPVPVFVTSLSPTVGSSYPYTQIVLAQVITSGGAVTDINMSGTNRSYDFSQQLSGGDTGDVIASYAPKGSGWIAMDDGSIGSPTSGATTLASDAAYNLYRLFWSTISDTYCPVAGGRGATAFADFYANKALTIPGSLGRALCNIGGPSSYVVGQTFGESTHTLTTPEMPAHNHPVVGGTSSLSIEGITNTGSSNQFGPGTSSQPETIVTQNTGGGGAHNNVQPSSFLPVWVKL